jgi:DNA-binding XRE family transcriptional regulator
MTSESLWRPIVADYQALRVLREAAGLKQAQLAAAVGVSRQYLHNIEAGSKQISPRLAGVIAAVLAPRLRSREADVRLLLSPEMRGGSGNVS